MMEIKIIMVCNGKYDDYIGECVGDYSGYGEYDDIVFIVSMVVIMVSVTLSMVFMMIMVRIMVAAVMVKHFIVMMILMEMI